MLSRKQVVVLVAVALLVATGIQACAVRQKAEVVDQGISLELPLPKGGE